MPRKTTSGTRRSRKSARSKQPEAPLSWPGRVARRIKTGIKKLVG
ncbi:MAG: hypothetical protein ACREME_11500 [Gemmatimonadales bacterium]